MLRHLKLFSSDLSSQSDEKVFVKMEMKMKNLLLDWLGKQTGMIYVCTLHCIFTCVCKSQSIFASESTLHPGLQHGTLGLVVVSGGVLFLIFSYCLVYGIVKTRGKSGPVIKPFK